MKPRSSSNAQASKARSRGLATSRGAKTLRVSRTRAPKAGGAKKSSARTRRKALTKQINANAEITIDHEEIQHWAEDRGGIPAVVKRTHRQGPKREGILRIDFPGFTSERMLEHISWDEWFDIFDEHELAFICQRRKVTGEQSTFNKLVSRAELV